MQHTITCCAFVTRKIRMCRDEACLVRDEHGVFVDRAGPVPTTTLCSSAHRPAHSALAKCYIGRCTPTDPMLKIIFAPLLVVSCTPLLWRGTGGEVLYSSHFTADCAKYVTIISAPARLILTRVSSAQRRKSNQPCAAAACSMAYSPLT